jgi:hypothetical protein
MIRSPFGEISAMPPPIPLRVKESLKYIH